MDKWYHGNIWRRNHPECNEGFLKKQATREDGIYNCSYIFQIMNDIKAFWNRQIYSPDRLPILISFYWMMLSWFIMRDLKSSDYQSLHSLNRIAIEILFFKSWKYRQGIWFNMISSDFSWGIQADHHSPRQIFSSWSSGMLMKFQERKKGRFYIWVYLKI